MNLKWSNFQADHNKDGQIDKEEFLNLVKNENDLFTKRQESVFKQYIQVVAYGEEYRCRPPPFAILSFTIMEILLYIIDRAALGNNQVPKSDDYKCSYLYYNPFKRNEVWRYMTYMFVHTSDAHLIGNMVMQLLVGIPLEMSHGAWRVTVVYCFGVMAGSLASSVFDPNMYLGGASGGVYALVASHLGNFHDFFHGLSRFFEARQFDEFFKIRIIPQPFNRIFPILAVYYNFIDTRQFDETSKIWIIAQSFDRIFATFL